MDTPGTSTSSDKDRMEAATDAISMLAQGKRNMVCGEIPNAVNQFQEACKVLAKTYGETAKECAEAYFYYGQSLLDLARMETGVLGNALQGVPDDEEETDEPDKKSEEQFEKADKLDREERERLRMEVYDAMAEQEESKEKKDETKGDEASEKKDSDEKDAKADDKDAKSEEKNVKSDEKVEEKKEKTEEKVDEKDMKADSEKKEDKEKSDKKEEEAMETSESASEKKDEAEKEGDTAEEEEGDEEEEETAEEGDTAEEGEKSQEEGEGKEDPDDVSNLQLAWEMLELAKVIYLKEEDKPAKLKAAEAYLKLGEVSLETEQYEQSVSDFKECLKIQEQYLEADDRLLAETHYQLGLAYGFNKQYEEAVTHYNSAIKGIEDRIAKLNKIVEEKTEGKGKEVTSADDPVKVAQQEIKELMEILPDIKGKIEDTEEEKKNLDELKNVAKGIVGELAGAMGEPMKSTESTPSEPQKKATDITHLVRRKRKPEDEENDVESKKTKQEDGSGDAAGQNGIVEDPKKAMDVDEKKKADCEAAKPAEAVAS